MSWHPTSCETALDALFEWKGNQNYNKMRVYASEVPDTNVLTVLFQGSYAQPVVPGARKDVSIQNQGGKRTAETLS
jgi:hypothetical protein